jgi:signal transduction histidine kinase
MLDMLKTASTEILKKRGKILQLWEDRAKREVTAAFNQSSIVFRDSISVMLEQLSKALSMKITRTVSLAVADRRDIVLTGIQHGKDRASSIDYTMAELIFEYHILRQVIFQVLEREVDLTSDEREIIQSAIDQGVIDSAVQFNKSLQEVQDALTHTTIHDLRGPVTAAKMGAQMILRHSSEIDSSARLARRIESNMDRLDSMIHGMLDVSRLKAGYVLDLPFSKCDLVLIAKDVVEDLSLVFGDRFKIDFPEECIVFWNDESIRRMIENLATNAAKYSVPDSPVTLTVDRNVQTSSFAVHNLGPAIPADEQALLFQQFRRARNAESNAGWGLGLALVKGIVEAHHGNITVISKEGLGTTFRVELPNDLRASIAA